MTAARPRLPKDHRVWWERLLASRGARIVCPALVGLVSLGFYLKTLAPGLTWAHDSADGGELAAAAKLLGIPHPPGYPTYVLLAHLFTYLPIGEVATRTNLFSAVCAAGTGALLTWAVAEARGNWIAGVGAGLALAFSPLIWLQAVVTEVHALNALFTALLLALAVSVWFKAPRRPARAALLALATGGAWGLSLANHPTALFCGPLVILAVWRLRHFAVWGMAGTALGLLVYLYLPLRAAADPPINWGDPRTPARFWWMVSGGPYDQFIFSLPRAHLPERLLAWTSLLTRQFGWIGLAVTALGVAVLWSESRPLFVATAVTVVSCSVFAVGYDTTDSYLYLIPGVVCLGLWLGWGLDWLVKALAARSSWLAWGTTTLILLLPLGAGIFRVATMDLSADRTADSFEAALLDPAPASAVILSQGDASTFALWYFHHGLGHRPDVVVIDTELLAYDWYVGHISRRLAAPPPVELLRSERMEDLRRAAASLDRPACQMESERMALSCIEP